MKKTAILIGVACLPWAALATSAHAQGPSYTYVQADYLPQGTANGSDYHGYGFEGSLAIVPSVYTTLRFDRLGIDNLSSNVNRGTIGVGLNHFFDYAPPRRGPGLLRSGVVRTA